MDPSRIDAARSAHFCSRVAGSGSSEVLDISVGLDSRRARQGGRRRSRKSWRQRSSASTTPRSGLAGPSLGTCRFPQPAFRCPDLHLSEVTPIDLRRNPFTKGAFDVDLNHATLHRGGLSSCESRQSGSRDGSKSGRRRSGWVLPSWSGSNASTGSPRRSASVTRCR
jgi:hypothetical protein